MRCTDAEPAICDKRKDEPRKWPRARSRTRGLGVGLPALALHGSPAWVPRVLAGAGALEPFPLGRVWQDLECPSSDAPRGHVPLLTPGLEATVPARRDVWLYVSVPAGSLAGGASRSSWAVGWADLLPVDSALTAVTPGPFRTWPRPCQPQDISRKAEVRERQPSPDAAPPPQPCPTSPCSRPAVSSAGCGPRVRPRVQSCCSQAEAHPGMTQPRAIFTVTFVCTIPPAPPAGDRAAWPP